MKKNFKNNLLPLSCFLLTLSISDVTFGMEKKKSTKNVNKNNALTQIIKTEQTALSKNAQIILDMLRDNQKKKNIQIKDFYTLLYDDYFKPGSIEMRNEKGKIIICLKNETIFKTLTTHLHNKQNNGNNGYHPRFLKDLSDNLNDVFGI